MFFSYYIRPPTGKKPSILVPCFLFFTGLIISNVEHLAHPSHNLKEWGQKVLPRKMNMKSLLICQ